MYNGISQQTFRMTGKMSPAGVLDLACQCAPGQAFAAQGTLRAAAAGELRGELALSTSAGVFGRPDLVLRHGATTARETTPAGQKWADILPGAWFQLEGAPALYRFRTDGVGSRTAHPSAHSPGTPVSFTWSVAGDVLTLRFPNGWTDVVTLHSYQRARHTLRRASSTGSGNSPWVGCDSGQMPPEVEREICR